MEVNDKQVEKHECKESELKAKLELLNKQQLKSKDKAKEHVS